MGDRKRGVYHKFNVTRTDGKSAPGGKHDGCFYFVLDCDHDPHAKAALIAYAASCDKDYPALASDVRVIADNCKFGSAEGSHITDVLRIQPALETRSEPPVAPVECAYCDTPCGDWTTPRTCCQKAIDEDAARPTANRRAE